jgi:general secretion pathway protein K
MRPSRPDRPRPARQGGFALLIVLWSLVLLSLLIGHVIATGRGEARIAANIRGAAVAEAAADGAAFTAVFHLLDTSPSGWPADGEARRLQFGPASAVVRATPLAGKVNPNLVSKELLSALLRALGTGPGQADAVAQAVGDWHGRVFQNDQRQARMVPYRAAGLDYGPPLTPLESIEELTRVQGMTPALLAALEPHLSLHRVGDPDPAFAGPEVRRALQLLSPNTPLPSAAPPGALTAGMVEIVAVATAGDARFVRRAVVDIDPTLGSGYAVLSWEDGE